MFVSTTINVKTSDQGLAEIMAQANVQDPLKLFFLERCELKTASDFLGYVSKANYELELADLAKGEFPVTATFKIEQQRLYVTRARMAYNLATSVADN